jgi:hypothetical protein
MKYSLRTLLIVMLVAGPLLAFCCSKYSRWRVQWELQRQQTVLELERIKLELRLGEERFSGIVDTYQEIPNDSPTDSDRLQSDQ